MTEQVDPKSCQRTLTCFAVPASGLGGTNALSDSGIILLYEVAKAMFKVYGTKTLLYVENRYRETIDAKNNEEETGVYTVSPPTDRLPKRSSEVPVDNAAANDYLNGTVCPVDWVYSNRKHMISHLRLQSDDHWHNMIVPVIMRIMVAGHESSDQAAKSPWHTSLLNEASSYLSADWVVWNAPHQKARGFTVARQYLSPSMVKKLEAKSSFCGESLPPDLRDVMMPDEAVAKRLQTPQDPFRVSFIGRMSGAKNVPFILDVMQPLFALHGIQMEVVTTGTMAILEGGFKRTNPDDAMHNLIGRLESGGRQGRDVYIKEILPRQQCILYASPREGHAAVPRETAVVGVPTILPDRPWVHGLLYGLKYPFIYQNEEEALAMVLKIRDGRVTDEEARQFNVMRHDPRVAYFHDDAAKDLHDIASKLAGHQMVTFRRRSYSRLTEAFEACVGVGEQFLWKSLPKLFAKKGVTVGENQGTYSLIHFYRFLEDRFECLHPRDGIFRRIK